MRVSSIVVTCGAQDLHLTRPCVASIRHFYPDIDLYLIKDINRGPFCTQEIESAFNVKILEVGFSKVGWGFGKLEAWFSKLEDNFLIMDNDIVFAGDVLSKFDSVEADCVVFPDSEAKNHVGQVYYDLDELRKLDPHFEYPGWNFNTGHIVTRADLLKRSDFTGLLAWTEQASILRPDVFRCADQGVLNYILQRREREGTLKLARLDFVYWGNWSEDQSGREIFKLGQVSRGEGPPLLVHWAGPKPHRLRAFPNSHLLLYFEREYYRKVPFGPLRRIFRTLERDVKHLPDTWADDLASLIPSALKKRVPSKVKRFARRVGNAVRALLRSGG